MRRSRGNSVPDWTRCSSNHLFHLIVTDRWKIIIIFFAFSKRGILENCITLPVGAWKQSLAFLREEKICFHSPSSRDNFWAHLAGKAAVNFTLVELIHFTMGASATVCLSYTAIINKAGKERTLVVATSGMRSSKQVKLKESDQTY